MKVYFYDILQTIYLILGTLQLKERFLYLADCPFSWIFFIFECDFLPWSFHVNKHDLNFDTDPNLVGLFWGSFWGGDGVKLPPSLALS